MGHTIIGHSSRKRQNETASMSLVGKKQELTVEEAGRNMASGRKQKSPVEIEIPFQSLAVTTATAQISSLVFCLAWSVKFNFYESTATHCRVDNYLPSLSATLDFTPQRDIWRACIGLSGLPRFFIAYLYYKIIFRSKVLLWFHWIEIAALIGLSIVDSIRYFGEYTIECFLMILRGSSLPFPLTCPHLDHSFYL